MVMTGRGCNLSWWWIWEHR